MMTRSTFLFIWVVSSISVASCDGLFKNKDNKSGRRGGSELQAGQRLYQLHCESCHGELSASNKKQASSERILAAINSVPGMEKLRGLSNADIDAIAAALNQEANAKVEGAQLYAANCASCHGTLQKSQKLNKSAAQIKEAISNQPTMKAIVLTDQQIEKIAAALAAAGAPSSAEGVPELRDRTMLASRLKRAFALPSPTDSGRINSIIDIEILSKPEVFGGNCSRSEAGAGSDAACSFTNGFEAFHSAASVARPGLIRSWRLDRACKSIAAQSPVAAYVAGKVGGNLQAPPTEVHMTKFANLISPGYDVKSTGVKTSFAQLMRAASTYTADTQWRLMIYGVCGSLVTEKL